MIITISGDPGSGKSTVAKEVAKRLHLKHYSGGDMRGLVAVDRGITIDELNAIGEKDPSTDTETDKKIAALGIKEDKFIIDSRLAWHFIPDSIKIYLACDMQVAARRIFTETTTSKKDRGDEPDYKDAADVLSHLKRRVASDKRRYKKYYGLDYTDPTHYDLVIDTTRLDLKRVLATVLDFINARTT